MPDMKLIWPALAGIVFLVLFAGGIGWLLDHPTVLIVSLLGIVGAGYLLARRSAARDRV
jgi:hypothetical protein